MKAILVLILQLVPIFIFAQIEVDSFVDIRDGNVYATVRIDSIIWFQDNLMLETATSFYPNQSKKASKIPNGNFYTNKELEDVCPKGWRIPNEKDWEKYFNFRLTSQNGRLSDIHIDSLEEEYISLVYKDQSNKVKLFGKDNPLGLDNFGWVQGRKVRKWGTTTIWLKNSKIDDKRFHLHINDGHFVFHRHKHNIDDKKRKLRKFMVKCVKDVN